MSKILFIFFLFFLVSCEKKDPNPELRDPIYQDLNSQLESTGSSINQITVRIDEIRSAIKDMEQAPNKKKLISQLNEAISVKNKLEQQQTYWKIRIFDRKSHIRKLSISSQDLYKADQHEIEVYMSEKKLRQAKNAWDVKQRFQELGAEYSPHLLGEGKSTAPPKKKDVPRGTSH